MYYWISILVHHSQALYIGQHFVGYPTINMARITDHARRLGLTIDEAYQSVSLNEFAHYILHVKFGFGVGQSSFDWTIHDELELYGVRPQNDQDIHEWISDTASMLRYEQALTVALGNIIYHDMSAKYQHDGYCFNVGYSYSESVTEAMIIDLLAKRGLDNPFTESSRRFAYLLTTDATPSEGKLADFRTTEARRIFALLEASEVGYIRNEYHRISSLMIDIIENMQ